MTAPIALLWVRNRKIPVIRKIRKSPLIARLLRPMNVYISQNMPTIISDAPISLSSPKIALLPEDLRTSRTVEW